MRQNYKTVTTSSINILGSILNITYIHITVILIIQWMPLAISFHVQCIPRYWSTRRGYNIKHVHSLKSALKSYNSNKLCQFCTIITLIMIAYIKVKSYKIILLIKYNIVLHRDFTFCKFSKGQKRQANNDRCVVGTA